MTNYHQIAVPFPYLTSRREFLRRAGNGFGSLALLTLLEGQGLVAGSEPAELGGLRALPIGQKSHYESRRLHELWAGSGLFCFFEQANVSL